MTGRKPITYTGTELTRGTPLAGLSDATLAVVQCQRHQVAVVNTGVVRLYIPFAIDTGVRLTYFANGTYRPWMETVTYWPMVESGQIQLGNHTRSHPDLAALPKDQDGQQVLNPQAIV
jgi:hypothetical protein